MPEESTIPPAGAPAADLQAPVASPQKQEAMVTADAGGSGLMPAGPSYWTGASPEDRARYLTDVGTMYYTVVQEFYDSSNRCVERYQKLSGAFRRWRATIIISTAGLAVVNLLVAQYGARDGYKDWLPVIAAVYAAVLTLLTNLESMFGYFEKAQAHRESREIFLDAARDFDRLWRSYVSPFGNAPEACVNAGELYRQITVRDRELRTKYKELTAEKSSAPGREGS